MQNLKIILTKILVKNYAYLVQQVAYVLELIVLRPRIL